jgi:hypothetical protein
VETYLLHFGIEQQLLEKIQVLGYHYDHIYISAFHKTLDRRRNIFIGNGMKTIVGTKVLQKIIL